MFKKTGPAIEVFKKSMFDNKILYGHMAGKGKKVGKANLVVHLSTYSLLAKKNELNSGDVLNPGSGGFDQSDDNVSQRKSNFPAPVKMNRQAHPPP